MIEGMETSLQFLDQFEDHVERYSLTEWYKQAIKIDTVTDMYEVKSETTTKHCTFSTPWPTPFVTLY